MSFESAKRRLAAVSAAARGHERGTVARITVTSRLVKSGVAASPRLRRADGVELHDRLEEGNIMTEYAVVNPATGETVARYETFTDAQVEEALRTAAVGFGIWWSSPVAERAGMVRRAAELHRERREELAAIIVREMGKVKAPRPRRGRLRRRHHRVLRGSGGRLSPPISRSPSLARARP